ncbi:Ppx/GppA phosphatase family protein [Immundisolibacter sp.]|uniref:Ppx/GppA phosphatase family protein n=1 Tax=Immundisolibacter sp. TaxID=1934948 RepID=UPI0025C4DCF5|nr:Ppx/GppA phosphatase family protein [Immundisolibacter sp.]
MNTPAMAITPPAQAPALVAAFDTIAAVDLGSNSFHLMVARVTGSELQVIDRLREPIRLGAGLDGDGNLTPAICADALACLRRFGERLRRLPAGAVRAVGTNALRLAANSERFLAEAQRALGHPIEVVSGVEEARLIYLGVAHSIPDDGRQQLVIDIGGGSTEMIIGRHYQPLRLESLYLGCVSHSQRFFGDGRITAARLRDAELAALVELEPIISDYRALGWERAIGASGSMVAVADALRVAGLANGGITASGLRQLRKRVLKLGRVEKLSQLQVRADRLPVFMGGLAIVTALFEGLGLAQLEISDGALRQGLLYDQLGRIHNADIRDLTVAQLARRYHVDGAHARRVARTLQRCLGMVGAAWELTDPHHARLLTWAAQLHEIGLDVAHAQYHKHGAYILEHADLAGFSRQEQHQLALLVRVHRRKFALTEFATLADDTRRSLTRQAVLLRLVVALHRSRAALRLPRFTLHAAGNTLTIDFPPGWLERHPLTGADLAQEAQFLAAAGFTLRVEGG